MRASSMESLVEIRDVHKVYRRDQFDVPVLNGITLAVPRGDFLALMGPSGSGKTTLLNLIAGIDRPSEGSLKIGGVELSSLSRSALAGWRAENVGYIFQLYNLVPVLTAYENVELPLLLHKLTRRERHERVALALSLVGLSDRHDHYPRQVSGRQE